MSTSTADGGAPPAGPWDSARTIWRRIIGPADTGLPRWPTLIWFPAILTGLLIVLVRLGISGSSTGMFWQVFGDGTDPNLIAGVPRSVRSDEWLTHGSWIVSQSTQGYPAINRVLPGGLDMTVLLDLPTLDWSTIFRPHAFAFPLLGLDRGLAVRWWLPGFSLMIATYWMFVVLVPRRPITGAVVAIAFFYCPLLQWWYAPSNYYPATLCFLVIAVVVVSLRDRRLWVRILWALLAGYFAICTALTLYPPNIIPALLVGVAIAIGLILDAIRRGGLGFRSLIARLGPSLIAGVGAGIVLCAFILTRVETIRAITGTVYPGTRLQQTGSVDIDGLARIFSAPFEEGLTTSEPYAGFLGATSDAFGGTPNASEAATPVLIGLFLTFPLVWIVARDWRRQRRLNWAITACVIGFAVFFLFLLVPHWDTIAHLVLLDRTTVNRSRIGLALLCVVAITLLVRRLDEGDVRIPLSISLVSVVASAASIVLVWIVLTKMGDPALAASPNHRLLAVLFVLAVFLYCRGKPLLASFAFLIISIVLSIGINPLYRGIFDLSKTAIGQKVIEIDGGHPGSWLGIGSYQLGSVLVEAGVRAFNGVQIYPPLEMWHQIDPSGRSENIWNRYASLSWELGAGEPTIRSTQSDVVIMTFDSCSKFAQGHVTYVMADRPVDQRCLQKIDQASQGPSTYSIYRVVNSP